MAKMAGGDDYLHRLKRMTPAIRREVNKALFVAGGIVEDTAKGSIMEGSVSGKQHVASRPGEPPSNNTQYLHNNIETVMEDELVVEVSSNASYSRALEYGTSKMEERPFMRPALAKSRAAVVGLINEAVDRAIKQSKSNG